ncbi:MAG: hypothetical protein ACI4N4_08060 [Candidatus Fimenecus sp.]
MGNDIKTILRLTNMLKIMSVLKTALTVGIIAFTVFRIAALIGKKSF